MPDEHSIYGFEQRRVKRTYSLNPAREGALSHNCRQFLTGWTVEERIEARSELSSVEDSCRVFCTGERGLFERFINTQIMR